MGVSVRVSRNVRVYLPFWLAIPTYMFVAVWWLIIWTVLALIWLVTYAVTGIRSLHQKRKARQVTR